MKVRSSTINSRDIFINIKNVILFVLIFFILDRAISFTLTYIYSQINTGPGRYNYITKNRFDGIIMGSSTSAAYYSDLLSKELGMSFLNVGMDGSALIYSKSLLDLLIVNGVKPKVVILNIDLFEIQKGAWFGNYYSMIEKLAPLYGQSDLVDDALYKNSWKERIKYKIASFRYNDLLLSLIAQSLGSGQSIYSREKYPDTVLSIPLDKKTISTHFNSGVNINEKKIALYEEFIQTCRKYDITLYFSESPIYYPQQRMIKRDRELQMIFESLASAYKVPFIKITQDNHPEFRSNLLFKDVLHLNNEGSTLFSKIVAKELRKNGIGNI